MKSHREIFKEGQITEAAYQAGFDEQKNHFQNHLDNMK